MRIELRVMPRTSAERNPEPLALLADGTDYDRRSDGNVAVITIVRVGRLKGRSNNVCVPNDRKAR